MPYRVTGKIVEVETNWGVPNIMVEVWDVDPIGQDDRLGSAITGPDGSFALIYQEEDFQDAVLDRKPDLQLVVKRPDGSLLVDDAAEVRYEAGRHESYLIQLPRELLGALAPERGIAPDDLQAQIAAANHVLSVEEEAFVEAAIGEERTARRRAVLIVSGVMVVAIVVLAWFLQGRSESSIAQAIANRWGPAAVLIETPDETGSGLIFDKEGHILTNYHVVDSGGAVTVRLANRRSTQAEIVGVDPVADLAVLHVDVPAGELVVAPRGRADSVRVGDLSIAIGNPLGLEGTLTVGHVSAVNRSLETADPYGSVVDGVIQTDAAINPGSSGGPLFNGAGQVVGINTQIVTVSGGSVGLGFAIPIGLAERIAHDLIADGVEERAFLGVAGAPAGGAGVRVNFVAGRSAADRAGVREGDILLSIAGETVGSPAELNRVVHNHTVGDTVTLTIQRDGDQRELSAELGAAPLPGQGLRIVQVQVPDASGDLNAEWVMVENQGYRTRNLQDYSLSNGQDQTYTFPDFRLPPLRRVRVHTGSGTDGDTDLYWGASDTVWQSAQAATLRGPDGEPIDQLEY
jgi:putative serine protease PepD